MGVAAFDLTGLVFGRLVVLSRAPNNVDRNVQWRCRCSCGEITVIRSQALRAGTTRSCGCLRADMNRDFVWRGRLRTSAPVPPGPPRREVYVDPCQTIHVGEDVYEKVERIAQRRGISKSAVLELILADLNDSPRRNA